MINKKAILIIVMFIVTGFLVFSFANPSEDNDVNDNNINTDNKVNNTKDDDKKDNKKEEQTTNKDKKDDDDKNDSKYDSLDRNNNLGNNYNGTQTNNTLAGGNTGGNQTGGNTGDNKPTVPDKPAEPEINVDELTGPSVFVSNDKGIEATIESGNVVNYKGVVEKANVDDFGIYYINVVVRAPYKYSNEVLKNATIVTPYGEKYNAGFLEYDSDGYAYFSMPQGFVNGVSSELSLTVYWGVGENIVYTLKSSINVVD